MVLGGSVSAISRFQPRPSVDLLVAENGGVQRKTGTVIRFVPRFVRWLMREPAWSQSPVPLANQLRKPEISGIILGDWLKRTSSLVACTIRLNSRALPFAARPRAPRNGFAQRQ